MHIPVEQPFHLALSLESGQAFRWRREGEWYWGVIHGHILKICQTPSGLELSSTEGEGLRPLIRSYFRLEDDLEAIYREIGRDEHIAGAIARYRGMRLLRQEPWECLVSYICSANSSIPHIARMVEALAEAFGRPVSLEGRTLYTFPEPYRLAEAGEERLRGLGLGFRARYVAEVARQAAEGRLDLADLHRLPYEEARERLVKLPGAGGKVADCVLLFSLDKLEAFPVDRWVRRALADWYPGIERQPPRKVSEWARSYFGPYAGYAQQYLFFARRARPSGPASRRRSAPP
jgi:N-glycosylase/DNA lyase